MGRYRQAAVFLAGVATCIGATTWVEVSTPQFEIITDAGETAARQLVIDLEQFDAAVAHSPGPLASFGKASAPVRIYLFRTESEFAEYRPETWVSGFTLTGSHAPPLILIYAGAKARQTILHEYVHVLVKRGDWKLPHWFEEGLAEFYAHSERSGPDRLSVGRAVPEHVAELKFRSAHEDLLLDEPHDETAAHRFYAASWGLVNMIMMDPGYRSRLPELISADPRNPIFVDAVRRLPTYLANSKWKPESVAAPGVSGAEVRISTLTPNQIEFTLAALLLDAGKLDAAQTRYQRIAAGHPEDALGPEAAGLGALAGSQLEQARTQFRRAIQLGSSNARVWSELAALDAEAGVPWKDVRPLLERAAQLDPDDYQAPYKLGVRETDEGRFAQAVVHLAAAAHAAPGKFDVWNAYAFAFSRAGRLEEARVAAKHALRVATPEWEQVAQQFLNSLNEPPIPAAPHRHPEVITPSSWDSPKADAEVSGKFVEFVCAGDHPLFRVEIENKTIVELKVTNPHQVNILKTTPDRPAIDLRCGPQDGRPIRLEFRRSDSTVLGVEFPQVHDLPRF